MLLVVLAALGGCAYGRVDPDPRAARFETLARPATPPAERALLVVNGAYYAYDAPVAGAGLSAEKRLYGAVASALRDAGVVREVTAPPEDGDLQVLVEFILEDDVDPMHRTFSMLTLYVFPMWKMVRLTARARVAVRGERLPTFKFESEMQEYRSPIFVLGLPFLGSKPIARLTEEAARALAVHLARALATRRPPAAAMAPEEGEVR